MGSSPHRGRLTLPAPGSEDGTTRHGATGPQTPKGMNQRMKLDMTDIDVFHKSMQDSGDSGEQLLAEVVNLENAVEQLKHTFKGSGAVAYNNFMVEVDACEKKLYEALGLINVGQGEMYRSYVEQEETMTSDAEAQPVDFPMGR